MKKILLITIIISPFIFSGCVNSNIELNNKDRIIGIVDACKSSPDKMEEYLQKKVNNNEISEIVSFTIETCLK